jgi:hypothetical protein
MRLAMVGTMRKRTLAGTLLALSLATACSSRLPAPRTLPPMADAFVEVPYPPPPARVESIPEKPREGAVWIDGQWSFFGNAWRWENGGWVMPPPNGYFTRWTTQWTPEGRLLFAKAGWRTQDGKLVDAPERLVIQRPNRRTARP